MVWDEHRDVVHYLNEDATRIWQRCDGSTDIGGLLDGLDLGAESDSLRSELEASINEMCQLGLLSTDTDPVGIRAAIGGPGAALTGHSATSEVSSNGDTRTADDQRGPAIGSVAIDQGVSLLMLGCLFEVEIADQATREFVASSCRLLLAPASWSGPRATTAYRLDRVGPKDGIALFRDGNRLGSQPGVVDATSWLLNELVMAAATRSGLVLFHAAAVVCPEGAILVLGGSGSGKSTLAGALVLAGFEFVADEVVAIDPDTLRAMPLPRPIKLERSASEHLDERLRASAMSLPPERSSEDSRFVVPQVAASEPVPIRELVLVHFGSGAQLDIRPADTIEALRVMLEQRFPSDVVPVVQIATVARMLVAAPVVDVRHGDVIAASAALAARYHA